MLTLMVMESGRHRTTAHAFGSIEASVCHDCGSVDWSVDAADLDPWEALEEVIGQLRVEARMDGVATPGPDVFVSARPRAASRLLAMFEKGRWLEIGPDLYASTDGRRLLLSPVDPTLMANLAATIGQAR
jgi:hypothetical protein